MAGLWITPQYVVLLHRAAYQDIQGAYRGCGYFRGIEVKSTNESALTSNVDPFPHWGHIIPCYADSKDIRAFFNGV